VERVSDAERGDGGPGCSVVGVKWRSNSHWMGRLGGPALGLGDDPEGILNRPKMAVAAVVYLGRGLAIGPPPGWRWYSSTQAATGRGSLPHSSGSSRSPDRHHDRTSAT